MLDMFTGMTGCEYVIVFEVNFLTSDIMNANVNILTMGSHLRIESEA